jgi:hypothetical protein
LGLHRHFVWGLLSVTRLPALALLVANILTHLAAFPPPMPTGFWDRHPKKRLVASVASRLKPFFHVITLSATNFAKSAHRLHIYPRF